MPFCWKLVQLVQEQSAEFPDPGIVVCDAVSHEILDDIRWNENPEKLMKYLNVQMCPHWFSLVCVDAI